MGNVVKLRIERTPYFYWPYNKPKIIIINIDHRNLSKSKHKIRKFAKSQKHDFLCTKLVKRKVLSKLRVNYCVHLWCRFHSDMFLIKVYNSSAYD